MKVTPHTRTRLAVLLAGATVVVGVPLAHAGTTNPGGSAPTTTTTAPRAPTTPTTASATPPTTGPSSSRGTVNLGAHVTLDTRTGTYFCFGKKATIVGTNGNDTILLRSNDAVVVALGGNDQIRPDMYKDAQGSWVTYMTSAKNVLVCAGDGDDHVFLGGHVDAGPGNDWVYTNDEKDSIDWVDDGSVVYGGPGNDFVQAGANSVLHGGLGNDELHGTTVYGDGGDDRLDGKFCSGGAGNDTVDPSGRCDNFAQ